MRWLIFFVAMAMVLGCGGELRQLAVETMQNANVAITSADAVGAQASPGSSLHAAQELLTASEDAMNAGDAERAYRKALRAYLHARIATETAIALREEAVVKEAQAQLVIRKENVAEVLQRLEVAREEFDALRSD